MTDSRGSDLDDGTKDAIGAMMPILDERQHRIFLAVIAENSGWGSCSDIAEFTGYSLQTLKRGREEAMSLPRNPKDRSGSKGDRRMRAEGRGRKSKVDTNPEIKTEIIRMLDGNTVGNPESSITWTTKSTRSIADELKKKGIDVSYRIVGDVLKAEGYSLQQKVKHVQSGNTGPDRDEQFRYIQTECELMHAMGCPVISVDAKKKELTGNYENNGSEYRPVNEPRHVNGHDFEGELGKAVPYGCSTSAPTRPM